MPVSGNMSDTCCTTCILEPFRLYLDDRAGCMQKICFMKCKFLFFECLHGCKAHIMQHGQLCK